MKIRVRLTLWYAGIMFVSLMAMGALSYRKFIVVPGKESEKTGAGAEEVLDQETDFKEIARIVISCGAPALLLAVAGGWWLMRTSLAPVASLTEAAARVNEGNLREQLPRSGNGDELDRLTEVFNSMLMRLDESFRRVHEFTLHASHELKTPLTILRGQAETALREETLTPTQQEFHAGQLEELMRLARIVDSLTLLAKADAGLLSLKLAPLSFDELVRENFADAQILAQESDIQLELTACESATVCGDQHRLRQLLLNLADNAIKYNSSKGRISSALRRVDGQAEFTITNTGPGISPESLPRVFDRFYRGPSAQENDVEGCGLGLSIAHWIVAAHHGAIRITSEPSLLTKVVVTLPLVEPQAKSH